MTIWCTPADLVAAATDIALLAALAGPTDRPPVAGALLRAVVAEESLAEWPPGEQAAALLAQARLLRACTAAGELVESYLGVRWPAGLDPVPGLVRWAAVALAYADLLGERAAGPESPYAGILRQEKAAHRTLAALQNGTLALGLAVPAPSAAAVRLSVEPRTVTMTGLRGL